MPGAPRGKGREAAATRRPCPAVLPGHSFAVPPEASMIKVTRIGHATFETPDIERQIDYFTNVIGLVLAERDAGHAYLATRVGDLAVQLDKGDASRCSRLSFQAAPGTDFGELRRGLAAGGLGGDPRAEPRPG